MFIEDYLADVRRSHYSPAAWVLYARRSAALAREHAFRRPETMRSLGLTGVFGYVLLLVCGVILSLTVNVRIALDFFRATGLTLLVALVALAAHLRLLTDASGRPLRRINPANLITLARLISIPAILVFIDHGLITLALWTFLAGAATDVVDGWLARHMNDATPLGRFFDPIVDVLFASAMMVSLNRIDYLPTWVLLLVLTRYTILFVGAAWIYVFHGPVEVKPTVLGKASGVVTTALILGLVGGRLWLPPELFRRIAALLVVALGFIEGITIPQVLLIGWYNFKRAGRKATEVRLKVIAAQDDASAQAR